MYSTVLHMASCVKNTAFFFFFFFFLSFFFDKVQQPQIKSLFEVYQRRNPPPPGAGCEKREEVSSAKGQSGGHAAGSRGRGEPAAGGIPLHGKAAPSEAKKAKIDLCPSPLPRVVNTSRAAASLQLNPKAQFKAKENQKKTKVEHTVGVGGWVGQNFTPEDFFFSQLGFFLLSKTRVVTLYNYLLLCVLPKCWFVSLFNLALSGRLNVSEEVVVVVVVPLPCI